MRRGETKMYNGRAVRLLAFGSDGISVRYLSSGALDLLPHDAKLTDPTEPEVSKLYNTALTPGRARQ